MNLKKKIKGFFTLTRKADGGFTLVELIVVIAILAILAGVAVPAYSGYITQTNKQADITLVSDVAHALTLAYYNGDLENGYIILSSAEGTAPEYAENAEIVAAMENAFGTNWANMMTLKYDGWLGMTSDQAFAEAYLASSYNGNEDALVSQLGSVTNTLKNALASNTGLIGDSFNNFLTTKGVNAKDPQAVSNAAVLYAASTIADPEKDMTAVNAAFTAFYTPGTSSYANVVDLTSALKDELGTFGAVAAIYAHGEAFGQYVASSGDSQLLDNFHNINAADINTTEDALTQVGNNLMTMVGQAQTNYSDFALQYIGDAQYANDLNAYLEAMKQINANAGLFADKLGEAGCYTDGTADAVLKAAVSAGFLGVNCENGQVAVWVKDGVAYNTVIGIQD